MKLRKLLLCGIATGLLAGCSTTPDDQKPQVTEETRTKDKERKIEQNPTIQYLFGNSAKVKLLLPGVIGGSDELWGTLSSPIKETIKSIWRKFENKGFSGYNASLLDAENVRWSASFNAVYTSMRSLAPPQTDNDFHSRFVEYLVNLTSEISLNKEYFPYDVTRQELKYTNTLFGLQYKGKLLTVVKTEEGKYEAVFANEYRPGAKNSGSFYIPSKIDSDIPVTQAQIDEWNQVFIDALKEDPFFGKQMTIPTDTSDSASALAALKGKSGVDTTQLMVNGISGSQVDLGLPMYVQFKGSVDQGKSTTGMTGFAAYKLGNSVLGVIQSYANSGTGFNADSRQLESSIIAAHSFGLIFVEGQFGSVSATDVNFKNWSGVRSQVRIGIDTPFGAPFVQLTHRDFGHASDTAAYVGFEIANTEFKADTYAFSTSLLTKVGHHSVHGATGSIDWTAALNLNSGIAFSTNLTLSSALESKATFNLSLDR